MSLKSEPYLQRFGAAISPASIKVSACNNDTCLPSPDFNARHPVLCGVLPTLSGDVSELDFFLGVAFATPLSLYRLFSLFPGRVGVVRELDVGGRVLQDAAG